MAAKYQWFYQRCPFGFPLLRLLRHVPTSTLVGTAGAGRREMILRGNRCRGGVLVDLAVTPDHRSLGPALMLQQGLVDAATEHLDLLYGFPNPKAAAVFKRMGYERMGEIVRYARVLRHDSYLRSKLPRWAAAPLGALLDRAFAWTDRARQRLHPRVVCAWRSTAEPRMDTLWRSSHKGDALQGVRDQERATWLFDRAPVGGSRYLMLSEPDTDTLLAWFALQVQGSTLHVRDYWCEGAVEDMPTHHVLALLNAARRGHYSSISVEIAGCAGALKGWLRCGFKVRGARPVFGRWIGSAPAQAPSIFLTAADEDE